MRAGERPVGTERGRWAAIGLTVVMVAVLTGCIPGLGAPAPTSSVVFVSTSTLNGWKFDYYRNTSYPCSISGHQTFTVATKVGSTPTASAPLWVFLHGGGTGFFDATGTPQPDTKQMTEETAVNQRSDLLAAGLFTRVREDTAGFRMVAVSYCNRDLYSGSLQVDPNNPNTLAGGAPRTTNGLRATKAAIQFAQETLPTSKVFLHGGSAGSAGSYGVAWALQQQGIAPAGVVADASVVNIEAGAAAYDQGACRNGGYSPAGYPVLAQRVHPDLANLDNEADKLIVRGELTVPFVHIWNPGDGNTCGTAPMACPLRDGSVVTLGSTDCMHQPVEAAIAAQGASSRSLNMRLCVDDPSKSGACDKHVVTTSGSFTNTDPAWPSDYLTPIMDWVHARLAD